MMRVRGAPPIVDGTRSTEGDAAEFPQFSERFRPRGVQHCWATEDADTTDDERYGLVGKQRIEDTGPLTKQPMETIDDEVLAHAVDFIERRSRARKPFFAGVNTTHMHLRTHPKPGSVGQAGRWQSPYHDTIIDHDNVVGALLDKLGIADDTVVVYSTDNGPHMNTWPDAGMAPFRSEKNTNWEGAFRVPEMIRWPGRIPAGQVANGIGSHHDWLPTFLAMVGEPSIVEKLKTGHQAGDKNVKVHVDGFNLLPYLLGDTDGSPRPGSVYFSDDGDLLALRYDSWKLTFMEQRMPGTMQILAEPFVTLRVPKIFNLRTDPFEPADVTSNSYSDWFVDHAYIALARPAIITQFLASFREFPPRQKAASFTIDQALDRLNAAITSGR
jgi:arylsulfatase A-like enzyme